MSRLVALLEVLLGFFALAVFAYLAFAQGQGTDEGLLRAFRRASPIALAEVAVLLALVPAVAFKGQVQWAAVLPVIALSWFNRLLRHLLRNMA